MANKLIALTIGEQYAIIETQQVDSINLKPYLVTKLVPVRECTFEYREIDKQHHIVTGKIKQHVSRSQIEAYIEEYADETEATYTSRH